MAIAKEVRTKIQSVKNTQKITRAMEMVAASKMRKAQERMQHAKPYAKKMLDVIGHVARSHPEYPHPFLQKRAVKRVGSRSLRRLEQQFVKSRADRYEDQERRRY